MENVKVRGHQALTPLAVGGVDAKLVVRMVTAALVTGGYASPMDYEQIVAAAAIAQVLLLLVNAAFFIWYLVLTHQLRKTAERQVEGSFRPALVVLFDPAEQLACLQNLGFGPALEVEWELENSDLKGGTPLFRPHENPEYLPRCNHEELREAAIRGDVERVSIVCRYKSLSGRHYSSHSSCEPLRLRPVEFRTTLSEG